MAKIKIARVNTKIFCDVCGVEVELTNYRLHCRTAHKKQEGQKKTVKKDYNCEICGKNFSSLFNLNYHLAHHYNLRNFVCDICPNAYNTKSDLNQHKRTHENKSGSAFICTECGDIFVHEQKLQVHMKKEHGKVLINTNQCSICNRSFSSPWHLEEHFKKHVREKEEKIPRNFECNECDKVFKQKNSLKEHVESIHRGLKKHVCIICGKAFGSSRDRRKHELIHERGRNKTYCTYCKKYVSGDIVLHDQTIHVNSAYNCDICQRKFPSSEDLQRHHSLKHLKRQHVCDICANSYSDLYHLRIHIITHLIEKEGTDMEGNYCCQICGKKFNLPRSFARHILTHENVKDFECDFCKKKFVSKSDLIKHKKIHDNENYCKICKTQVSDLKEHYNIHPDLESQCDDCPARFKSQSSLNYHKKSKHSKGNETLKCFHCEKSFHYKSHLHKHLESHEKKEDIVERVNVSDFISDDLLDIKLEPIDHMICEDLINIEQEVKVEPMEFQLCNIKEENKDKNCLTMQESNENFISEDDSKNFQVTRVKRRKNRKIPLEKDGKKLRVTCRVCCAKFNTIIDYQDHFLEAHVDNEDEFYCKACNLSFDDRKNLQTHFHEIHEIFKCQKCKRQFTSKFLLDEHKKEHEEKDRLICMYCGKLYANRISLQAHTDAHHLDMRFDCDMCDKSYSFKAALYKHRQTHLVGKKHKCSECKYMAKTKYEVKLHYNHHHTFVERNNEKYYCNICGITFANASTLSRHNMIQHDGFIYTVNKKCVFCKEPVKNNYQAVKHMALVHLHGKRKLRQCGFCKTEIELYDDYKEHISAHQGVFICRICGDPFFNELLLQNHIDTHKQLEKELRQYGCDYCGQKKSNRTQMEAHMISHHAKYPTLHHCEICGKSFKLASVLYTHLKYHAEGSKTCSYCEKKFVTNTDLTNHIRIHHTHDKPFKCYVCHLSFYTKPLLKEHHQSHPQTMIIYNCKMCKITFGKNKKEKDIHDGNFHPEIRPFRCLICNLTFTHEHHLNKHELKHSKNN